MILIDHNRVQKAYVLKLSLIVLRAIEDVETDDAHEFFDLNRTGL